MLTMYSLTMAMDMIHSEGIILDPWELSASMEINLHA